MRFLSFVIVVVILLSVHVPAAAQIPGQATCPAIVEDALEQIDQNCANMGRNSACYGYNLVRSAFFTEKPEDYFAIPAAQEPLIEFQSIETTPLDIDGETWGVALLNVQANVPGTLPGQGVVFILMGQAGVENAVAPEDAVDVGVVTASVASTTNANLRSGPGTNFNVVGAAQAGIALEADGLSADGEWLRVLAEDAPAWINRSLVTVVEGNPDELPVITDESRSPMQAFYFTGGLGDAGCSEAPDMLAIQGPGNVRVSLNVNGADIEIGSTVILRQTEDDTLEIMVLDGFAVVDGVEIPAGVVGTVETSEDGTIVAPPTTEQLRPIQLPDQQFTAILEQLPSDIINYNIIIPTLEFGELAYQNWLDGVRLSEAESSGGTNAEGGGENAGAGTGEGEAEVTCEQLQARMDTIETDDAEAYAAVIAEFLRLGCE
ncbi:MAG: SH3 domain-containing protein [bacterium]|nr:SH3 domain-containing protein [bacterium]